MHEIISLLDSVDLDALSPYERIQREEHLWGALCQTLDALAGDALLGAVEDARDAAAVVRPEFRRAPRAWLNRLLLGKPDPRLTLIRHIRLTHARISDEDLRLLIESDLLQDITTLRLDDNLLTDACAPLLANLSWPLQELWLGRNQLSDASATALAHNPNLATLASLGLGGNAVDDPGAIELISTRALPNLRELHLSENQLSDITLRAIAHGCALSSLERLYLYGNQAMTDEGAQALLTRLEHHFPTLQDLDLSETQITPKLAHTLATSCPARP